MNALIRKDFDENFTIYKVNDGKKEKWGQTVYYRHPLNPNDTFYAMFNLRGKLESMVHMNPSYVYTKPKSIQEVVKILNEKYTK